KPDQLYPECSKLRYLSGLPVRQAVVQVRQGQSEAASEACLDMLEVGVKLPRGGSFIPYICALSIQARALRALKYTIAHQGLSRGTLAALPERLRRLEAQQTPLREVIACDYQSNGPGALELTPSEFWECLGGSRHPVFSTLLRLPGAGLVTRKFIAKRLPALMKWDAELARLSMRPFYEIRDEIPSDTEGLSDVGSVVMAPLGTGVLRHQATLQANWRGTRIVAQLELHRLRTGKYPARLAALTGLRAADLQDPFSGKPLRYKQHGRDYVLYSVGENGNDNGGKRVKGLEAPKGDLIIWPDPPSS
ncbi:MAG: hypothetical protein ABFE08_09795, partial [Armatimonadia bacterium]